MMTNSTLAAIRNIKYGYSAIANARTFKTRLTLANANVFFDHVTEANRKHLCVYNTAKGYTFIAVVTHYADPIWDELAYAHGVISNNKLRAKANKKFAIAAKKTAEANMLLAWVSATEPSLVYNDKLPF